jgi:hypothetical protein
VSSRKVKDVQIKGYHLVVLHYLAAIAAIAAIAAVVAILAIVENRVAHLGGKIGYYNENYIHIYYIINSMHCI